MSKRLQSAKNSFDNKHDNAKDWKRANTNRFVVKKADASKKKREYDFKKRGNKIIRKSDEQNVENAGMKCQRTTCEYNVHEKFEKKIYKKNKDEGTQWDDQQ